jgi:hypothetical protein
LVARQLPQTLNSHRGSGLATIAHLITAPGAALWHAFYHLWHCPVSLQLVDRGQRDQISAPRFTKGLIHMTDLKLIALDTEDLEVISAHVQDAVVRVADMGYARGDRRFALLMNRFDWEAATKGRDKGVRKRAALHFDAVQSVVTNGFDPSSAEGVLALLAITFTSIDGPAGIVELSFAGGGTVRLGVECLEARLSDLGAAWAAAAKPKHALE